MKVWWCGEHESVNPDGDNPCHKVLWIIACNKATNPCRMVEMQLVPADARVVWPCHHAGHKEEFPVIDTSPQGFVCTKCGKFYYGCDRCGGAHLIVDHSEEPLKDPWDYDP